MNIDQQKDARSLLVSLPGILVLAVLSVLSAYYRVGFLPFFLFAITFVAILSALWGRYSLRALNVEAVGQSTRVFPGEEIHLTMVADNDKLLPLLWFEASYFQEPPAFLSSEDNFSRKFTWIGAMQTLEWETTFKGEKRGVAFLSHMTLRSGDGFGLSVDTKEVELEEKYLLVVYPKVFAVDASELVRDTLEMHPGQKGYIEDYTLFKGSRDYIPGDSSRFINWRVLARQNQLSVNLFEPVVPECVTFLLDLKSFSRWEEESATSGPIMVLKEFHEEHFEEMLSLVASAILALTERKVRCALLIPRIELNENDRKPCTFLRTNDMDAQIPELLTALAKLTYKGEESLFYRSDIVSLAHSFGEVFAVVNSPETMTIRKALDLLNENQVTLLSHDAGQGGIYRVKTLEELRKHNA